MPYVVDAAIDIEAAEYQPPGSETEIESDREIVAFFKSLRAKGNAQKRAEKKRARDERLQKAREAKARKAAEKKLLGEAAARKARLAELATETEERSARLVELTELDIEFERRKLLHDRLRYRRL